MTRVAIYARYSSDLQTDASIEDQIRLCEGRAEQEGWTIFNRYTDHGISGASLMRPGVQMLMQDAAAGRFDIIIAEALDRLSRDQEDIAGVYKRIQFAGAKIVTLSEGEVSNLHIGLKGTMNAIFLKDLADKTRRGLSGRVLKGKSGGGITYGYDVVRKTNAVGEPIRGERTINLQQAAVVRRIFEEYATGKSPKAIAVTLNKEGIAGPSGRDWGPSTIYGNRARGTGVINNELYIGRMIWNRLRYIKDPDSGKRVSRLNPESDWIITEVPELRIIDQELWDQVRSRQGKYLRKDKPLWKTNRPRNLFSYLIKCGACGGGMSMISGTHIGCSTARNKGTCDNRLSMSREKLEQAVLGTLKEHLMDESLCEEFCKEYTREMNRLNREHNASLECYRAELKKLDRARKKLVESIMAGVPGEALKDEATQNEERRKVLESILERTEEAPVLLHPNMAKRYHEEVRDLIAALNDEEHRAEATELVRALIDKIILTPSQEKDRLVVDLVGDLAGILAIATNGDKSQINSDLSEINLGKQDVMVAGRRLTRRSNDDSEKQEAMVAGGRIARQSDDGLQKQEALVAGARYQRCLHLDYAYL